MVFDWERQVESSWLDVFEFLFSEFDLEPAEGTGNLGKRQSHGAYKRVRRKLAEFLGEAEEAESFSIRIRSEATHPRDGFFPSDALVSFGVSSGPRKAACFAVREGLVSAPDELVQRIGPPVLSKFGAFYGGAWDFPAAFGPDAYLVSLGAVPKGHLSTSNADYFARITQWRKNVLNRKLRPASGYFREVYPINFLLETHLNMPFRDEPLSGFMTETGTLRSCDFNEQMYRWDVPKERLEEVQGALESSGLILSSEVEPLRIN